MSRFLANLPNIPEIKLDEPVGFSVSDGLITLKEQAVLAFSPGKLMIRGFVSKKLINLDLQGAIPLVLARFFVPLIQRGDGLANGQIALSGSSDALLAEGKIIFEPGASIVLKRWLDPIDIREGKLIFNKTSKNSFKTRFDDIKLAVGDGRISLDGDIEKHYGNAFSIGKTTFNLDIHGSNIIARDRLDFVESDFTDSYVANTRW